MSRFAPAHRSDSNQAEIVKALRDAGWLTVSLSDVGNGCPDVLAWHQRKGYRLVEIKTKAGKLEPKQEAFIKAGWPIVILRSVEEALSL
jgi:Holliday junction resolvase